MSGFLNSLRQIREAVERRGLAVKHPSPSKGFVYQELTGVVVPGTVIDFWSEFGGVDVLGVQFETESSAGVACAARTREAESYGPGFPSEVLDGSSDGIVRKVWWDRHWVPLVVNADSAIALDLAPGGEGVSGQVIYCDMDMYFDREVIWKSLRSFVDDVACVAKSEGIEVNDGGFGSAIHDSGRYWPLLGVLTTIGRSKRDGVCVPFPRLREACG